MLVEKDIDYSTPNIIIFPFYSLYRVVFWTGEQNPYETRVIVTFTEPLLFQ